MAACDDSNVSKRPFPWQQLPILDGQNKEIHHRHGNNWLCLPDYSWPKMSSITPSRLGKTTAADNHQKSRLPVLVCTRLLPGGELIYLLMKNLKSARDYSAAHTGSTRRTVTTLCCDPLVGPLWCGPSSEDPLVQPLWLGPSGPACHGIFCSKSTLDNFNEKL